MAIIGNIPYFQTNPYKGTLQSTVFLFVDIVDISFMVHPINKRIEEGSLQFIAVLFVSI